MSQGMIIYAIICVVLGITFMALGNLILGTLVALCGPIWLAIQVNANETDEDEEDY
jgi:hypothetical protein|tara:strand:- start:254 stop:421 length:168 start_codon:yes stop_codon:yes gene_type:complete